MSNVGYAVVDVETTGLFPGRHDRVVEIGVVLVDRDGRQVDEWGTLVNPARDLGPQHIHGIKAKDVLRAPSFADIAGDLAARLAGRVVVAHNLSFDLRFILTEYGRMGAPVPLVHERGLCTMALSGSCLDSPARSLAACCAAAGIDHVNPHSALHDARACAELLAFFIRATGRPEPWFDLFAAARGAWPTLPRPCGRTSPRTLAGVAPPAFLERLIDRLPRVQQPPRADEYLALLDRALLDRHISASEQDGLIEVAQALGLTYVDVLGLHRDYLDALARAARADDVVTDDERLDLGNVAGLLGLTEHDVELALRKAPEETPQWGQFRLRPGDLVAFTGQMVGQRDEWENRATRGGLRVAAGGVTKRTRLLVAADPDSLSGKAVKARQYGIPIVTPDAFGRLVEQMAAAALA
ncbi:exonuclease domain-containing protein [Actinophytocola sp.]|uniref:exonuclease domain-containing protein n=1 Tax=Actinophytocola sp. TaxID=1872138 RepID=UPI00389A729F